MAKERLRVLVTGADQHQGLAVIRGLGSEGVRVIACGPSPRSMGFFSRYASERHVYTTPGQDAGAFVADVVRIARASGADLILPTVESTLVPLASDRERVERVAALGAPPVEVLEYALDKAKTVELARRVGVPVPRTANGADRDELLQRARVLRFPVAVKPQGNPLHAATAHRMDFKVLYARGADELERILQGIGPQVTYPLVQEYARGTGVCVAALCRAGDPLALVAYSRDRETPLSGGVSVLRTTIALDPLLRDYVERLLRAIEWHGVAMVEFKHDAATGEYTLMEINGRFQASTALSLDAGVNLPYMAACLYTGRPVPRVESYAVGVRERWLRGDLMALRRHLSGDDPSIVARLNGIGRPLPSKQRALLTFFADFAPGVRYDEFKLRDWRPGVLEGVEIVKDLLSASVAAARALVRRVLPARRVGVAAMR